MPEPLHPPYSAGSLTIPRTLIRWLDVNAQNGALTRNQTFITLPSFAQASSTWNGYSDIVATFNCESPSAFSLTGLSKNTPLNPNYTLCISYQIQGIVTRYILWDVIGSNLNASIPFYTGQPIKKNFRFEIWNTSLGAVSQSTAISFYTSVLGGQDYRYAVDSALQIVDTENDSFNSNSLTVLPASVIQVSGAGFTALNGIYNQIGIDSSGNPYYSLVGKSIDQYTPNYGYTIYKQSGGLWKIHWQTLFQPDTGYKQTSGPVVASPDLVLSWTPINSTTGPVPTVTAIPSGFLPLTFPIDSTSQTN
jgi:hypothetical protein